MRLFNLNGLLRGLFSIILICFLPATQAAETGLLWQLQAADGKISYLFGTIHSDDARVNDFSPSVLKALSNSEAFVMETLPASDTSLYLMQDANLRDLLNEKELAQVRTLADFHSMDEDIAMRMKPWLLAMVFDLPKPQTPYTQDAQLLGLAQSKGKEILGLEDTAEHFAVLDDFTLKEHLIMLRAVLKRSQADKERDFEALVKAYARGDADRIAALDDQITGNILPKGLWARMRAKLIDERNVRMAQRAISEAGKRPVFIAVGASHLPGKNGLLELLRKAGYKVSAVK
jgi:uncharacterized protein YbaP (TraB family)